jgi:hypothetical protein
MSNCTETFAVSWMASRWLDCAKSGGIATVYGRAMKRSHATRGRSALIQ